MLVKGSRFGSLVLIMNNISEVKANTGDGDWDVVIGAKQKWWTFQIKEIIAYKDLLFLFVRRDFIALYKQTVLGPLWLIIQPIFSTIVFTVIFGRVAKIPTDGIPGILFYLSGLIAWNYFADCLNKTSNTFVANSRIFGKVYFPRLIVPLSVVISSLFKFCVQLCLLLAFIAYYWIVEDVFYPTYAVIVIPFLLIIMAGLGLGIGIIISSFTTKYRDFQNLVAFGVQLLMYATPIVYPLSLLEGKMKVVAMLNPMTHIVETFKYAFLGAGSFSYTMLLYSFVFMCVVLLFGVLLFGRVENRFMDTV